MIYKITKNISSINKGKESAKAIYVYVYIVLIKFKTT